MIATLLLAITIPTKKEVKELPLKYIHNKFYLEVQSNDSTNLLLLVDTGCHTSMFDKSLLETHGYKPVLRDFNEVDIVGVGNGRMSSNFALNLRMLLSDSVNTKIQFPQYLLVKPNCKGGSVYFTTKNRTINNKKHGTVVGIVGADFFMRYEAVISYKDRTISLLI